ncbi:SusC/RagA family TonB-linked outer membrane protein [Marinifilum caeruleilacunae]|uniref:TonB-dependent receptor n=1 Tax=Marinifilum caeruleilacunae TaxID=2499076 RepID=A0ABX1WUD4_9BACT|nr:TonB-dependent receptor [Marinifilum caeruleilacunae]NOU59543.1 TonB-dependent receptor [Marinifilum caeruleilacunae]
MKRLIFIVCAVLISIQLINAQTKQISGTVTSADDGMGMPGVSVVIKGTTSGTSTDIDGKYALEAQSTDVLVFSFVGMISQEILVGEQTVINVSLETESIGMDEVVVVGYGTVDEKRLVQNVAVIDEETLENLTATSSQELLQGRASGVQMTQSSGVLGAFSVVRVRGVGSLTAGSSPLIVVDGVPMNDGADFNYTNTQGGNTGLNTLIDINPNDIESMNVLKDASATAIYGSRGANGVIIIKTKSGSYNKDATVTVDFYTQWTESTDEISMANADEYRQYLVDIGDAASVDELPQGSFDWPSAVTQTGFSYNADVSVRGGSERIKYYLGVTYSDQEGFVVGNEMQRIGGRLNFEVKAKEYLNVGANLNISQNKIDRVGLENSTFAPMTSAYLQYPWVEPYDENGNYVNTGFIANVIAIEDLDLDDVTSKRSYGNFYAELDVIDGLKLKTDFGFDQLSVEETERSYDINSSGGYGSNRIVEDSKWLTTTTASFDKLFDGTHRITALGGISYEESTLGRTWVEGTNFPSDDLRNVESAAEKTTTSHIRNKWSLFSLFSRVGYSYAGKYTFEGSLRRDGSSRFGPDNKYGTFWSVAGGYTITEEEFMQDLVPGLDFLKLTASYGVSGNDKIGYYPSFFLYTGGNDGNYNGTPGLVPSQAGNAGLKWEENKSLDIGLRSRWLNGKIQFDLTYYRKDISDLLINQPLTYITGYDAVAKNVGEMENSGIEIDINATIIKTPDLEWNANFNMTTVNNEITALPNTGTDVNDDNFIAGTSAQRAVVGRSANEFYLIRYAGINPQTGDAEWLTADGQITTNPTSDDRVYVGSAQPDFFGGFSTTLKYKGFDLSGFFNYSSGNKIMVDGFRFTDRATATFNVRKKVLNYWQQPGDNAYAPSPSSSTAGIFAQRSDLFLFNASYLRMKNLTLGYTIPESTLNSLGGFIKSARFYVTMNNVFTIKSDDLEGIDPEVTDDTNPLAQGETFFTPPQSKSYIFGLRVSF